MWILTKSRSTRDGMAEFVSHNFLSKNIEEAEFRNVEKKNYRPANFQSPLVDSGKDLSEVGILWDFKNRPRPSGDGYDIGAFELKVRRVSDKALTRFDQRSTNPNDLTVVPNPVINDFTINHDTFTNARIAMFSDTGLRVLHKKNYTIGDLVDVSGLRAGIYFFKSEI